MSIKISIDTGFSAIKIATITNGILGYFKEQNAVCELGSDNPDSYTGHEDDIVKFQDNFYIVGKSALEKNDSTIKKITDYESMRAITPIIATKFLKNYDPKDVDSLCFTLSSAFIKKSLDYADYLKECLPEYKDKIRLIPQGAGIKKAIDNIGLDVNNTSYKNNYTSYLIIDIGFLTIDVCTVINGSLLPNDIKGYEHTGAILIAEEVQKQMKSKFNLEISIPRVKSILEDKVYKVRQYTYDCSEIVQTATQLYLEILKNFLEKTYKDDLNAISNVILMGGGCCLVQDNIDIWEKYYGKGFMIYPKSKAEFYNALGGLY